MAAIGSGLRTAWPAAAAAVSSGGAMMASGYLLRTSGSGAAGLMTIPGGVVIILAFRLACRRSSLGTTNRSAHRSTTLRMLGSMGLPDDLPAGMRFVAVSLTLVSGAVMMLGGYSWGHGWPFTAMFAVLGGSLITAALTIAIAAPRESKGSTINPCRVPVRENRRGLRVRGQKRL